TADHRLPGARLRAAGAEGGGRSRPAGASSRGRSSIMRPDRLSDHDDDDRGAESGPGRRPPDLDLPIFDPEDAEAEREAGAFPDVEDEEDDEAELDDESLSEEIEGGPQTVLITGACGNLGRKR